MPGQYPFCPFLLKFGQIEILVFTQNSFLHFDLFTVFCFLICCLQLEMAPKPCWSRSYFTKNAETGKFECDFCKQAYLESTTKFKNHLLVSFVFQSMIFNQIFQNQCKKIGPQARAEINKLAGIKDEPSPKRPIFSNFRQILAGFRNGLL